MLLADTLSRAYSGEYERSATESEVECIHATHFLPVSDQQLKELQREMASDPTLQFLKKAILDGFQDTKEKQPAAIHQYFEIRDELSVHGGVIFKGQPCIIMQTPRQKMEQKLHDSHIGSQGCLCRAQETVYWPGMNAKITDYIQKCVVCRSLQKNQTKVPLICHEPTSRSWEKVATDIIHTWWQELSVHSNYYSGYFEVDQLHGKTETVIIKKLKKHFVTHGTPNELLSGNEPPFNSSEFENFLRSSGSAYVTGSLGYPQKEWTSRKCSQDCKELNQESQSNGGQLFSYSTKLEKHPNGGAEHFASSFEAAIIEFVLIKRLRLLSLH